MDPLLIYETSQTPRIHFDGGNGVFSVSGKSYPENVTEFYQAVFDYIQLYKSKPQKKTIIEFNWLYYNTATSRVIIRIIIELKDVSNEFEVKWICKKGFDLMIEKGQEIMEVLDVDLNIVSI